MIRFLRSLYAKWLERRGSRSRGILEALKVSYHTFRVILLHNDQSLDMLRSVDQSLKSPGTSWPDLAEEIEELLSITYELVDGLNGLSGGRYDALYERHHMLEEAVHHELDTLISRPWRPLRFIPLDDLGVEYRELVGGKASRLAFLKRAGFPVPDGFAVTSQACGEILSATQLDAFIRRRLQRLELVREGTAEVAVEAAEIREKIMNVSLSADWEVELKSAYERLAGRSLAVRSSALMEDRPEHSFAGQFTSVLQVTSFDSLKTALKEVIASGYNARSIAYRLHAGLRLGIHDMGILCQCMVPAKAAGGLFTLDPAAPDGGRMLISAVCGLGTLAVNGSAPADLYRPLRVASNPDRMDERAHIAEKTHRAFARAAGGILEERISGKDRTARVISQDEVFALVRCGRVIEGLIGRPQDIEWAIADSGDLYLLQSRDIRLTIRDRQVAEAVRGAPLLEGGVCASPGRSVGVVRIIKSAQDLEDRRPGAAGPDILVLHQSMVDAAGWLPGSAGVVVDLGNPADHLSCLAREFMIPMITGTGRASEVLAEGRWVILDADAASILEAPAMLRSDREALLQGSPEPAKARKAAPSKTLPEAFRLRRLIVPLNLTDAYGPTFSIHECQSLHDIIRFSHEMAVMAMFDAGDEVLAGAEVLVHRLDEGMPFHFLIIDLGGGIMPDRRAFRIRLGDLLSVPLLALWEGMSAPGLCWNQPPPAPNISGLLSRAILDGRSARPVGNQNYALITRDYLNLNARMDFHFTMLDAVCGANPRANYVRFRFKGGGTISRQRERRARFIGEVFEAHHFFTDVHGDLVNASLTEARRETIRNALVMIGRLLGFSRLLDATMGEDTIPKKVAQAFLENDYALQRLRKDAAA